MDERLKQRLVGAAVLSALFVIFAPMVLDYGGVDDTFEETPIPAPPEITFRSRIVPLDDALDTGTDVQEVGAGGGGESPPVEQAAAAVGSPPEIEPRAERPAFVSPARSPTAGQAEERVGLKAWAVQLASFLDEDKAVALRDRLRKQGFTAFVETVYVDKRRTNRVYVGPELLRSNAEKAKDKLKESVDLEGLVVRFPRG